MESSFPVPRRSDLLNQMTRANRLAWILLITQIALLGIIASIVDWGWILKEPRLATIAIAAMVTPYASSIAMQLATKKKRIQDLKESTRFGQFDKVQLQSLFRDTVAKLRLPDDNLPVYIVASPSVNAFAQHFGLGWLFKSLNGIYLNRQTLHKLNPAEVQDIMGHELGHLYKYYLVVDRFRIITLALGAALGILVVQKIGLNGLVGYVLLLCVPPIAWMLSTIPHARYSQTIEYLCDDFGAQVGGVFSSIHGLLKLGLASEVECVVMHQAILSKVAGNFNPSDLIEAINSAIPYGHATREEIQQKVDAELKKRAAGQKKSLSGLLKYMWNSDVDAEGAKELAEQAKKLKKLQALPRLDWESLLPNPNDIYFNEERMHKLISLIESRPDEMLFRIPESLDDTHPPLRTRLLYLWYNRSEIEGKSNYRM